jgi:hypothetical protein
MLSVLVIIAVMVGCFLAYNLWNDQQRAKAEELKDQQRAKAEELKDQQRAKAEELKEKAKAEAEELKEKAKAEEPFFVALKDAIDELHNMRSAVAVGITYQKYGDQLIALAAKVDKSCRLVDLLGPENSSSRRDAYADFSQTLIFIVIHYKSAYGWWELKIRYPKSDNSKQEYDMQADWKAASDALDEADKKYAKLKNL